MTGEKRRSKYSTSVRSGYLPGGFQCEYGSILDSGILDVIGTPTDLRARPSGLDQLRRLRGGVPRDWPVPSGVSCSWPLYFYYTCLKKIGQKTSAMDLRYMLGVIRNRWNNRAVRCELHYMDDFFRLNLKNISGFCFPRIFSGGPVFQLFTHLHALTGKCPFTQDQIINDISTWVSDRGVDGVEKNFRRASVAATLDRVFTRWRPSDYDGHMDLENYSNDFMRWGTSGGGPRSTINRETYRTKWAWGFARYTGPDGCPLSRPSLYQDSLATRDEAIIALKEEAPKTREIIATPMPSYLRQSYLLYRWGKPKLPSPISSRQWVSQFEQVHPKWYGCIDGEKFDQTVPRWFVIDVIDRLGGLDAETRRVADLEIEHLRTLSVHYNGRAWKWEGGLLSGWRLTSVMGTLASVCAADYIRAETGSEGSVEIGAMGDDLVLWSYNTELRPEVMVACYNDFGLRANLHKTISGPTGEFLRKVLSDGGGVGYPALGARTLMYANPWVSSYKYEKELELASSWMTFISRLHRHAARGVGDTLGPIYVGWMSNALRQEFGAGPWRDWVCTPVSAGGGGPVEFSDPGTWTQLQHQETGKLLHLDGYMSVAAKLGILKSKLVFKRIASFVPIPSVGAMLNYKALAGSVSDKDTISIRKDTNITDLIFGLASGRYNRSDVNMRLKAPLTRAQRGLTVSGLMDLILGLGENSESGLTSICHSKETCSSVSSVVRRATQSALVQRTIKNCRC